jgi:hypothetical protein
MVTTADPFVVAIPTIVAQLEATILMIVAQPAPH